MIRCECDYYNGMYNDNGICKSCDESIISPDRLCMKGVTDCGTNLKYGQYCLTKDDCNRDYMYQDQSKKQCVACDQNSEKPNDDGTCGCAEKYVFSEKKLLCQKKGLSAGAIAGIVIACVVVVAAVVLLLYFLVFKKGSAGAAKQVMSDTVTGNNDTAFSPAK